MALLAALLVNEVMLDAEAVGDNVGEWIELFNTGAGPVDLSGWSLRSAGDLGYPFPPVGGPPVAAGGFVVLGRSTSRQQNGDAPVGWSYGGGVQLSDDSDWVELVRPDGVTEARVEYGLGWPHLPGRSLSLGSADLDATLPSSWCPAEGVFGDGDRGTPNAPNDCAPGGEPDAGPPAPDAGTGPIQVLGSVAGGGLTGCDCASGGGGWWLAVLGAGRPRRRMRSS